MRYIATIFWSLILGQVIGFLVAALNSATYDPMTSLIVSAIFAVVLCVIPPIMAASETPSARKD